MCGQVGIGDVTNGFADSTSDSHGGGQAVPEEAGWEPASRAKGAAGSHGRERQPGHQGQGIRVLAASLG